MCGRVDIRRRSTAHASGGGGARTGDEDGGVDGRGGARWRATGVDERGGSVDVEGVGHQRLELGRRARGRRQGRKRERTVDDARGEEGKSPEQDVCRVRAAVHVEEEVGKLLGRGDDVQQVVQRKAKERKTESERGGERGCER